MADLRLEGCRSRPLIGYLKGVGLLRVVGRQADSGARARWRDGVLELHVEMVRDEFEHFLLHDYVPAPVVSPWNGGSGFFPKDNQVAIEAIAASHAERLEPFRLAVAAAREILAELGVSEKPEGREQKIELVRELRARLDDDALEWLDAALVLTSDDLAFPPLLGSGGNDGRYDFANNYSQAVVAVTAVTDDDDGHRSRAWLSVALGGGPAALEKASAAHFLRDASPVNSPTGESDALRNPWDLVLAVEGSLVLAAGAARRYGAAQGSAPVAPFTARPTAAGYGSALGGEKGRDELWLPLWSSWAGLAEIETLAREARAQVGRRTAATGLDFVRAAGELGVARGIDAFERYAVLERAGQSNLAVPVGQIHVSPRPAVAALRSLDGWLARIRRYAQGPNRPSSYRRAMQSLETGAFAFAAVGGPREACLVLERLGALEHTLARSRGVADDGLRPLSRVPARPWLEASDDGSPEFALAAAVASLRDRDAQSALPGVRDYLHGTRIEESGRRAYDPAVRLRLPSRSAPLTRLALLHARRCVDASRAERALRFDLGLGCRIGLIGLLASGGADADRVLRLLEGLALLDFTGVRWAPRFEVAFPAPLALEVLVLACAGTAERRLEPRPDWATRLASGAVRPVFGEALLRLTMAGLAPMVTVDDLAVVALDGPALSAALLLACRPDDRRGIARRLTDMQPQHVQEKSEHKGAST